MGIRENVRKAITELAGREKSKAEFARKVGATSQAVNNWISGANAPDIEKIAMIAEVYSLPMEQMLFGDEYEPGKAEAEEARAARLSATFAALNDENKTIVERIAAALLETQA